MGLGIIEIIILLLVVGGLVLALRGRPTMRKWARRGFVGLLLCCVALVAVGAMMKTPHWVALKNIEEQRGPTTGTVSSDMSDYRTEVKHAISMSLGNPRGTGRPTVAPKPGASTNRLPDWIAANVDEPHRFVVVSAQFADKSEANSNAVNKAKDVVLAEYQKTHGDVAGGLEVANVKSNAIRDQHTQEIIRTAGENEFTVYRTYLLVDTSPSVMSQFEQIVQNKTRGIHQTRAVIGAIALTAIMALLAGFFRLDDRTRGRYRWPLVGATFTGIALLAAAVPVAASRCAEGGNPFCGGPPADPATIQEAVPTEAPRPTNIEPWRDPVVPPPPQPESPHRLIKHSHDRTPGSTDCPFQSPWH